MQTWQKGQSCDISFHPCQWTFRPRLLVVTFALCYSVSWQSHVWQILGGSSGISLTSWMTSLVWQVTADRALSNCAMQFCLGLGLLHVSFLRQKIGDDFMIHPVDENWSLVLVSFTFTLLWILQLHTIVRPTKFVVRRPRPKFNDSLTHSLLRLTRWGS